MFQQDPLSAFEPLSLVQVQLRPHKTESLHRERSSSTDVAIVVPKKVTYDSAPANDVPQDGIPAGAAVPHVSELSVSAKEPEVNLNLSEESSNGVLSSMESKKPVIITVVHGHNKLWLTSLMPQWGPNWVNEAALLNVVLLNVIFAVCFLCCSGHVADLAGVKKR